MNISISNKTITLDNDYRIEIEYNKYLECNILYIHKLNMYVEDFVTKKLVSGSKPKGISDIEHTPIRNYNMSTDLCTVSCIEIKCKEKIVITY